MKKESKKNGVFTRRALLLGAGQLTVFGALSARLYQVQVVEGQRYATLAESNRISSRLIAPPRGRILDRFGTVIGGNKLNWRALPGVWPMSARRTRYKSSSFKIRRCSERSRKSAPGSRNSAASTANWRTPIAASWLSMPNSTKRPTTCGAPTS